MKTLGRELGCGLFLIAGISFFVGCSTPSKANIELRKKNSELKAEVERLKRQHEGDVTSIAAMEKSATTVPVLATDQVKKLFTVHGLQFGRLTGVDPDAPTSTVKVYVVPTDQAGEPIKAAGSFVVDVFDLMANGETRMGHAEFSLDGAAKHWFGKAMLYTYVLPVPCKRIPPQGELTVQVKFIDGLTGREFSGQSLISLSH